MYSLQKEIILEHLHSVNRTINRLKMDPEWVHQNGFTSDEKTLVQLHILNTIPCTSRQQLNWLYEIMNKSSLSVTIFLMH